MKNLPTIVATLLGLAFIFFGLNYFYKFIAIGGPKPEAGSPQAMFFASMVKSGFLASIKSLEIAGGILTLIPKTRNWGLLILGPIVVGILLTTIYIKDGNGLYDPTLITLSAMSFYLLIHARNKFIKLLN